MKKMKKIFALALAAALALSALTGCGSKEEPAPQPEQTPVVEQEEVDLSVLTGPVEYITGLALNGIYGSIAICTKNHVYFGIVVVSSNHSLANCPRSINYCPSSSACKHALTERTLSCRLMGQKPH